MVAFELWVDVGLLSPYLLPVFICRHHVPDHDACTFNDVHFTHPSCFITCAVAVEQRLSNFMDLKPKPPYVYA